MDGIEEEEGDGRWRGKEREEDKNRETKGNGEELTLRGVVPHEGKLHRQDNSVYTLCKDVDIV